MAGLLAEERRLFYVAVTRARKRLIVTASGEESDDRPSRFLAELAGEDLEIERVGGQRHHWLSLPALTADLRRAAADTSRPAALRRAAAAQLARLAAAGVRGADPGQWYALTTLSSAEPVAAPGETLRLSPSQVESFTRCGLRWLIESAGGRAGSEALRHLGMVVHAAAVVAAAGAADDEISGRIDDLWHHLDFGSAWYGAKQRALASQMVRKFLDWQAANPRELVAVEEELRVQVGRVLITGRVDRLERELGGSGVVVDLKTGSSPVAEQELDRNPQLGVYQLAMLLGAFEKFGLTEPGGAELVQVGKGGLAGQARVQRQHALRSDEDPDWAQQLVDTVAAGMAGPVFEARVNPGCRTCPVASCCPVHPHGQGVTP
jgi:RecB family exonuclease